MNPDLLADLDIILRAAAEQASNALSLFVGCTIDLHLQSPGWSSLEEVPSLLGNEEQAVLAVLMPLVGDWPADCLMVFDETEAIGLMQRLGSSIEAIDPGGLPAMERSMIEECTNICISALGNSLGGHLSASVRPAAPTLLHDIAGAIGEFLVTTQAMAGVDRMIRCDMRLVIDGRKIPASLMVCPTPESLTRLQEELGGD